MSNVSPINISTVENLPVVPFLNLKGFEVVQNKGKFITGFPIKIQTRSEYNAHSVIFGSAEEFSEWINERSGCDTYCDGTRIVWKNIPIESASFISMFNFFHNKEDLYKTEKDLLYERQSRNIFEVVA